LSKLFRDPTDRLAEFVERSSSRAERMSRRQRWLLGSLIIIAVAGLSYGVFQASHYLKGFEQYGALGAFLTSFIASSSIFFPVFGFVIVGAIAASGASNWALVALASASGSALGQFTAYLAGYGGRAVINKENSIWYRRAEDWMKRYGSMAIFFFALTFLPVDVIGIVAGALRFPYWKYLIATFTGYLPKTLVGCYLAHSVFRRWPSLGELIGGMPWWSWVLIAIGIAFIIAGVALFWAEWKQRKKSIASSQGQPPSTSDN
jgi:membrane protein YqaA with SNARE-associated domain